VSHVQLDTEDGIAVVTISNPPHGYMNEDIVRELDRATRAIDEDDDIKVAILTGGEPGVFVQHYDLKEIERISNRLVERGNRFENRGHVPERPIDFVFRRLESSRAVVIAAINGNAMGGGCEMSLACDIRLMAAGDYMIGLPEIRIGMLPGAGGTQRMTRLLGVGKTLDMILHGRRLSPSEALQIGLVNEVVEGSVLDRAMERARDLSTLPTKALAHIKRLVYAATEEPFYLGLDLERRLFVDLMSSPEGLEMTRSLNARGGDFRTV
jgi:enoyl-CoA hydratase